MNPRTTGMVLSLTLCLALGLALAGCGKTETSAESGTDRIQAEAKASASGEAEAAAPTAPPADKKIVICLLPKKKGLPYFSSCAEGAREAAQELGDIELIYDGPTDGSPEKSAAMIEGWTLKGVDAIAVSVQPRRGSAAGSRRPISPSRRRRA